MIYLILITAMIFSFVLGFHEGKKAGIKRMANGFLLMALLEKNAEELKK